MSVIFYPDDETYRHLKSGAYRNKKTMEQQVAAVVREYYKIIDEYWELKKAQELKEREECPKFNPEEITLS